MVSYANIDLQAGKEKAETVCAACHNKDGNSVNPGWPKLAGQHADYMLLQLKAYKDGKLRQGPLMQGILATMSEQDMKNAAAYFSTQKVVVGEAKPENLAKGEALYRGGNREKQISACIACHGPKGLGNAQAGFPALSGQHAVYLVEQLEKYKSGERQTDINSIMRDITAKMDPSDMQMVANYISGLH